MEAATKLVSRTYVSQGRDAKRTHEKAIQHLLQQGKLPEFGWSDLRIELLLQEFALMDSNNFPANVGVGEREARIVSKLVAKRHYRLGHGIGRSGDVTAVQPKAAGSSLLAQLTNKMLLDVIRKCGVPSARQCVLIPVATGMALMLVLLTLRQQRPQARYVAWPRIDQKSCFKCMLSAGLEPLVVENELVGDELRTDVQQLEKVINGVGAENVLCVLTTTSCFAPRAPDRLPEVARLCKSLDIPHLVNNAYGVQSTKCMHSIQEAMAVGRVDAFVQSTDKNFLVPVGGAIVASQSEDFIRGVAQTYPGRASSSPTVDVFITLLSLGWHGYHQLTLERKEHYKYLRERVEEVAHKYGERVLHTPHNPISIGVTLSGLELSKEEWTEFGSMLFIRHVSGIRVVSPGSSKTMGPHSLLNWGAHYDHYPTTYFTAAAAIGMSRHEVDMFASKLDKNFAKFLRRHSSQDIEGGAGAGGTISGGCGIVCLGCCSVEEREFQGLPFHGCCCSVEFCYHGSPGWSGCVVSALHDQEVE